ncbi:MAG: efflux RND transporter periplasmic adaptor subunit [Gammaproteobacteria bacterium]|nr:efflux RND transporter periplasmic adaptor subunit [Gammaproteobacteria bacterium]
MARTCQWSRRKQVMRNRSKQTLKVVIISLIILLIVIAAVWWRSKPKKMAPPGAPVVGIAKVVATAQQSTLQSVGTLIAIHGVVLKAPSSGRVTAIHFKSNQSVKQGQLLMEIDPAQLEAQLAADRAQLTGDLASYQRELKVAGRGVAETKIDSDKGTVDRDRALIAEDEAKLNNVMLTAPFAGKLGLRQAQVGQYLSEGDTLSSLEQLDPLWLDFSVPSRYLGQIKVDQQVEVSSDAWPGKTFSGKVTAISSLVASASDSITLRANLANSDQQLRPGQLVNVKLLLGQPTTAIVIPTAAVSYSDKGDSVYRVEQGKAVMTSVKLGHQSGDGLIVLSGLKEGDTIVVAGGNKIHGNHRPIKGVVSGAAATAAAPTAQKQKTAAAQK